MRTPADGEPPPFARRPRADSSRTALVASLAFVVLASVALAVALAPGLVLLSPDAEAPSPTAPVASVTNPPTPTNPPARHSDQTEAEQLLGEALRRVARLDNENVSRWGIAIVQGSSFPAATEALDKATALHDRGAYGNALPLFRQALAEFDKLTASKPERLRVALTQGRAALEALDAPLALEQLEIAAALAPDDPQATGGLDRARKLPRVLSTIAAAKAAEGAGDLAQARALYQEAATLDPTFETAQRELKRVAAVIAEQGYKSALSEAHARLNARDPRGAQAALERARGFNPQAPELQDVQKRIQVASQLAALDSFRAQAVRLEREEKWPDAVKVYDQALALDRQAAFASQGRGRAQRLAELHQAIDVYVAEPARLQSAEPLSHAQTLLAQSGSFGDSGPLLAAKTQKLTQLISAAQTPIAVLLRSDRNTQVVIQRVGTFGPFDTQRVDLPPGRYVAIGSRPGYRDARVSFEVSSARNEPVVVQCTEPIR